MLLASIINLKLKGRAIRDIDDKYFGTFTDLKIFLEKSQGENTSESTLMSQLQNCKQKSGENAPEFGHRVRDLVKKLNKCILNKVESQQVRNEIRNLKNEKGLKTFVNGLQSNLRIIIDAHNYIYLLK